ncbi:hypothetical protein PUN28_019043 [Cardiocondyla obscurior]|uniref:Uncharacterized protein n=1 Tax=Cardiocondyla obscurior TaxID=286306 RepID=A0AAW2EH95_9HYME
MYTHEKKNVAIRNTSSNVTIGREWKNLIPLRKSQSIPYKKEKKKILAIYETDTGGAVSDGCNGDRIAEITPSGRRNKKVGAKELALSLRNKVIVEQILEFLIISTDPDRIIPTRFNLIIPEQKYILQFVG